MLWTSHCFLSQSAGKDANGSWKPPDSCECPLVSPVRCRDGWQGVRDGGMTLNATHLVNGSNYSRLVSLMMMIRGVLKGLKCAALAAAESSGASGTWWRASVCVNGENVSARTHTYKQARTHAKTPTGLTSCLLSWLILIWTRASDWRREMGRVAAGGWVGSIHIHMLPTHTQGANWINNTYLLTSNLISYANQLR